VGERRLSERLIQKVKSPIVTPVHKQEVICGLFNSSNCDDLGCTSSSLVVRILFQMGYFLVAKFLYWQARLAVPLL